MWRMLPIFGAVFYAFGMATLFGYSAMAVPTIGGAAVPASLAFTATGLLGYAVILILRHQEARIAQLEERLKGEEGPRPTQGTGSDSAP